MKTYRAEVELTTDGTLQLVALPFQAGERVQVVIVEAHPLPRSASLASLRNRVLEYTDPFEPVASEDWDIAK